VNEQSNNSMDVNEPENMPWSFWLGVGFFTIVVIGVLSLMIMIREHVVADESLPVTQLSIMGEMPYTQKRDIEVALANVNLSNFFKVNVNQVQHAVSRLPWVYSVAVRKNWPNELALYVVDQTPIALWNGDFLLNVKGQAFQADVSRLTSSLPAFFGPEGSEQTALENYRNLNKLLKFNQLTIDELMLSERFAWQLTLSDGVMLNLGRENRVERIQRFMDVYPEIIKQQKDDQRVNYVDLRYDTGLAVGWKPLVGLLDNKTRA
jgi:cell division protein FtsQ